MSDDPQKSAAEIVQASQARHAETRQARERWEVIRLRTERLAEPLHRLRWLLVSEQEDYPNRPADVLLSAAEALSECGVADLLDEVAASPSDRATPEARSVAADALRLALGRDRGSLEECLTSLRAVTPGLWFGFWAELKDIALSMFRRHLESLARDLAATPGSDGMLFLHPFLDDLWKLNAADPGTGTKVVQTRFGPIRSLNTIDDIVRRMQADGVVAPSPNQATSGCRDQAAKKGSEPKTAEDAEGVISSKPRKGGRPPDSDPKADSRIFDAWKTRRFKRYEDLARELRTTKRAIATAIDRHRQRLRRRGK